MITANEAVKAELEQNLAKLSTDNNGRKLVFVIGLYINLAREIINNPLGMTVLSVSKNQRLEDFLLYATHFLVKKPEYFSDPNMSWQDMFDEFVVAINADIAKFGFEHGTHN